MGYLHQTSSNAAANTNGIVAGRREKCETIEQRGQVQCTCMDGSNGARWSIWYVENLGWFRAWNGQVQPTQGQVGKHAMEEPIYAV